MEYRNGAVDETHSDTGYHSCKDNVHTRVGGGLEESADDHDDSADSDGFLATELLTEDGCHDAAEETSYFIDGDYETCNSGGWVAEGVSESG